MTMPHLMNCQHNSDGWCLDCVAELYYNPEHIITWINRERQKCIEEHIKLVEDNGDLMPIGDYGQSEWLLSRIGFCDQLLNFISPKEQAEKK